MNVVFITSDQHRRDGLGCAAHAILKTPHLDHLAGRGVLFSNAYCDSPLCAPSRASYICGRHVHHHGALTHMMNGKPPGMPGNPGIECSETLGSMFRKAGYATAAIGKLHVHGETRSEDLGIEQRAHRFYNLITKTISTVLARKPCRPISAIKTKTIASNTMRIGMPWP